MCIDSLRNQTTVSMCACCPFSLFCFNDFPISKRKAKLNEKVFFDRLAFVSGGSSNMYFKSLALNLYFIENYRCFVQYYFYMIIIKHKFVSIYWCVNLSQI